MRGISRSRSPDKALKKSIKLYNQGRALLRKLDGLREPQAKCPSRARMPWPSSLQAMPCRVKSCSASSRIIIADLEKAPSVSDQKKRLMLVGSANDDVDFIRSDRGRRCHCRCRHGLLRVAYAMQTSWMNGGPDPYPRIPLPEQQHLPPHARLIQGPAFLHHGHREKAAVDGVILQNVRFCDLHGSENGVLERDLEAAGIPCMRLEREYGPLVETAGSGCDSMPSWRGYHKGGYHVRD